jgi:hypothetical protein
MGAADADPAAETVGQLQALADDMTGRGFDARVTQDGARARVSVAHRDVSQLSEYIYAAPTGDGHWWFWWSWGDRIAQVTAMETAAFKIAYVLMPHTND